MTHRFWPFPRPVSPKQQFYPAKAPDPAASNLIVLVISPVTRKRHSESYRPLYEARLGDQLITISRTPFLDGARALIMRGYDPSTQYNMRHAKSEALSFATTTLEKAALWTVVDPEKGTIQFRKFRPFDSVSVASAFSETPKGENHDEISNSTVMHAATGE